MASLYNRADIYDLLENDSRRNVCKTHWETILAGKQVRTLLDVSVGTGNVTLPAAELGVELSGSDLSAAMLENCRKKAADRGLAITLECCDFREVASHFAKQFDCVASTGNSLPYVSNADVLKTLEQMDALVRPGGYLYFDTRNWDKILLEKPRFYLYPPFFNGETRVNLVQVWDYHEDNTMTFHLLYALEQDNRIFQREFFEEHYIPIRRDILLNKLQCLGYGEPEITCFPAREKGVVPEAADWYCLIAQKGLHI